MARRVHSQTYDHVRTASDQEGFITVHGYTSSQPIYSAVHLFQDCSEGEMSLIDRGVVRSQIDMICTTCRRRKIAADMAQAA